MTCGPSDVLSISCSSSPDPEMEGRLRLMDSTAGAGFEYGRLEIFVRGFWSTICDTESFTPDSAQVACSLLGYDGGAPLNFMPGSFGSENQVLVSRLPVGLASVDCDGTETSLLQCTSSQTDLRACAMEDTDFTDATVLACGTTAAGCPAPIEEEGAVRLRGGFGTPCDVRYTAASSRSSTSASGAQSARCFARRRSTTSSAGSSVSRTAPPSIPQSTAATANLRESTQAPSIAASQMTPWSVSGSAK
eukprot:jgi/Ulvmu1/9429/UM051_0057.1